MSDEVVTKIEGGHMEGERHTHPSYGSLSFNRISGGDPNLFGTSVKHNNKINLVLRRCEYDRGLHTNWYHPTEELFEVEMSYTQFAELITSMNIYEGVPCTIKQIMGERTPPVPYYNPVEVHKKEFEESTDKVYEEAQNLISKVAEKFKEKKSFNKKEQEEILSDLTKISMNIGCNQKYQIDCFNEQMEHTVTESKGEVEAFVQHKMYQLAQMAAIDNPELVFGSPIELSQSIEEKKKAKPKLKLKAKEDKDNA